MANRRATGGKGEEIAVEHLKAEGYLIEARNWRRKSYELDIVARKADMIVFVEVKSSRPGPFGPPQLKVNRAKQKRIATAALEYLSYMDDPPGDVRFDIIAITWGGKREPQVCHVEAAFSGD